jgi:cytochrome P450
MMKSFSVAAVPMAWPVDVIPALQHWPESFPGGGFKTTARKFRKQVMDGVHAPYRFVQRQMAAQDYEPSFTSRLIQQCAIENGTKESLSPEDEEAIIWSSASLYGAAADTTVITLTAWTLAMIMFPEVQQRAQEEIDRVVGTDRLPTFDDRENLPYIDATVKEALRWWPIAAMGFPHTADEELEYEGYHIPKGAMIMPAVWSFMHDPDVYADPEKFDPERFLAPRNEPDPCSEVFGYGRRVCPGQYFADAGLFINIAQSAACFSISKAVGKDGKAIEPNVQSKPGVLHYPTEFQFNIAPRSEKHVEIIKRLETEVPVEAGDSHLLQLG